MLWSQMYDYLKSWFIFPGLETKLILISIGLALAFGAIWLLVYWPSLRRPGPWAVGVTSPFIIVLAGTFAQTPLWYYYMQLIQHQMSSADSYTWRLALYVPLVLMMGLVQEGAKMLTVTGFWLGGGRRMDARTGMMVGAMAGAGFGVLSAVVYQNSAFMSGWTWDVLRATPWHGLMPFWSQFWTVAASIATGALLGYGLAKGKGWQAYLLAAVLHAAFLYLTVLYNDDKINLDQYEIILAGAAALLTLVIAWMRYRETDDAMPMVEYTPPETPPLPPAEPPAGTPAA